MLRHPNSTTETWYIPIDPDKPITCSLGHTFTIHEDFSLSGPRAPELLAQWQLVVSLYGTFTNYVRCRREHGEPFPCECLDLLYLRTGHGHFNDWKLH